MTRVKELKEKALRIVPGVEGATAEWYERATSFNRAYGTDNGSVAFVENGEYYIMPFTREILETLEKEGFQDKSISVLISGWKRPTNPEFRARWEVLRAEQAAAREKK